MARLQIRYGQLPTQTLETLVELTCRRQPDQALLVRDVEGDAQGLLRWVCVNDTRREQLSVE